MPAQHNHRKPVVSDLFAPSEFGISSPALFQGGPRSIHPLGSLIEQFAPSPGQVVHIHMTKLPNHVSTLQPVIFTAVDAATHLQIAQINFAMTSAAALSFIDFVSDGFPFPISTIKTRLEPPFHAGGKSGPHRDVPALLRKRGIGHVFVANSSDDALFAITAKMVYGGACAETESLAWLGELQSSLCRFVFFHNNYRLVPRLHGKTPLQRLKKFPGFEKIHAFNPAGTHEEAWHADRDRAPENLNSMLKAPQLRIVNVLQGERHESDPRH